MESKFIIVQTSNSLPPSQRELEDFSVLDVAFLSVLGLGVVLSICIPIYDLLSKRKQCSPAQSPKPRANPICPGCQYFSNNHYLRCALQPTTVMTEQSIDCLDFCSIHQVEQIEESAKSLPIER